VAHTRHLAEEEEREEAGRRAEASEGHATVYIVSIPILSKPLTSISHLHLHSCRTLLGSEVLSWGYAQLRSRSDGPPSDVGLDLVPALCQLFIPLSRCRNRASFEVTYLGPYAER
jgi:hypothetical protein